MIYDAILIGASLLFGGFVIFKILPGRGIGQMEPDELKEDIKDNEAHLQLIDVRKPDKYSQFHIYGFRNIPLKDIRKEARNLDPTKRTILVCQTGTQSNEASKRLKRRGFKDIYTLRRGLSSWDPPRIH